MKKRHGWKGLFAAAILGMLSISGAMAGNADRVEEILGVPQGIPLQEFAISAKSYEFAPNEILVKQGDYIKLTVTSVDKDRVFKIPGTGIKHVLKKEKEEVIVLYARDRGKVDFKCGKYCGPGCFFMKGTIIIE